MNKDDNFIFQVSISKDAYKNKLETKAAVSGSKGRKLRESLGVDIICYYRINTTSRELLDKVLNGYTFCSLFSNFEKNRPGCLYTIDNGKYFTHRGKRDEFFEGSFLIGVDIDDSQYQSVSDVVGRLSFTPTFWYTSLSHMEVVNGVSKGVRLRLIYVFNEQIQDKYYFRYCSSIIRNIVMKDLNEETDRCTLSCSQYFNGTNILNPEVKVEYDYSGYVYSLSDLEVSDIGYYEFLMSRCEYDSMDIEREEAITSRIQIIQNRLKNGQSNISTFPSTQLIFCCPKNERLQNENECKFDADMIRDYYAYPWEEFYNIYKHCYQYIYRTEKNDWLEKDGILYQLCDNDYLELRWIPTTNKKGEPIRITDGHHRRKTLFHRAWLRRVIMPNVTPTTVLFDLLVDRLRFFDNSDGVLCLSTLKWIVNQSFRYDVEYYKQQYESIYESTKAACENKKFIVHWTCRKKVNASRLVKELRWAVLDELYDSLLSIGDNIIKLKEQNFIISRKSLERYCKGRGINYLTSHDLKYEQFKKLHCDGMSRRKEKAYLYEHGLELSLATISTYISRLQQEANDR